MKRLVLLALLLTPAPCFTTSNIQRERHDADYVTPRATRGLENRFRFADGRLLQRQEVLFGLRLPRRWLPAGIGLVILLAVVVTAWLLQRHRRSNDERQQQARIAAETLKRRLLKPDYDVIARRFGKPISSELRRLYSDRDEIVKDCVNKQPVGSREDEGIFVCWYVPLDEEAISDQWHHDDGLFDFADDGTGSRYTVDPTDDNAEIHYFQHEDQTFRPTGVKLRELLSLPEN